jgi:hypothetical protein
MLVVGCHYVLFGTRLFAYDSLCSIAKSTIAHGWNFENHKYVVVCKYQVCICSLLMALHGDCSGLVSRVKPYVCPLMARSGDANACMSLPSHKDHHLENFNHSRRVVRDSGSRSCLMGLAMLYFFNKCLCAYCVSMLAWCNRSRVYHHL